MKRAARAAGINRRAGSPARAPEDGGREPAAGSRDDQRWMRRALALARRGKGTTRPNPMVGAVVVRKGRLLGEGFHRRAGTPHAEIHALAGLGRRAEGATLYVTLEPCCHTGRTAPCTKAVIAAGIRRVVVAVRDPNPLVDGRGLSLLKRAGISVEVGCLKDEAGALNRPFFTWVSTGRPLVTLKAAMTLDGFIAPVPEARDGRRAPAWLTGRPARNQAHVLRAEHDAVLVGAGTVEADDPRLTVRLGPSAKTSPGSSAPLRVVLDGKLRLPLDSRVLTTSGESRPPPLVIGAKGAPATRVAALRRAGAEVMLLPGRGSQVSVAKVLEELGRRGVQSLLVEGGAAVHGAFIQAGLVDRVALFYAPKLLGGGVPLAMAADANGRADRRGEPHGLGRKGRARAPGRTVGQALQLGPVRVRHLGDDLLIEADVAR